MNRRALWLLALSCALLLAAAAGCASPAAPNPPETDAVDRLRVVATTSIVGDVVQQVGGERIDLTVLMGIGVDPHTYTPTPRDIAAIHDADIVFANGLGLEIFLEEALRNAGGSAEIVYVSEGISPREMEEVEAHEHEGEQVHEDEDEETHGTDPHVWFNVQHVIHWVQRIEAALSEHDPAGRAHYAANARRYAAELEELDRWIQDQIARIPANRRVLVTNHPTFGYFAERYGMRQIGAIYPINPSSEPSAQGLAALEDAIREFNVPAVFAESTVNPKLAEQVARDTGVRLVPLYTGSLGGPDSGAATYVEMMRYNVRAMVEALAD